MDCNRPQFPKRAVVTAGMPYGNKGLHFGHVGGVFVPADFFARFLRDRIGKENVLFVSGTDCYGSPIMEGYRNVCEQNGFEGTITDYVKANHEKQKEALDSYNISLDIYTGSGLEPARSVHAQMSDKVIDRLYQNKTLLKRETKQFFDPVANQFLNGRQVKGHCPVKGCKSEKAYADECDLGHQFDPEELIAPVSQLTGTTPELLPVYNWYFDLPSYQNALEDLTDEWQNDSQVRPVVTNTVKETLTAPVLYVQTKFHDAFLEIQKLLPEFTLHEATGNQTSFALEFKNWELRDQARTILEEHQIRFRGGKCLLPFRLTGNIEWGVKAPNLEGLDDLTIWCWPESLWAPISFTKTALEQHPDRYSKHEWQAWWSDEDAQVFQFIGQDNIYFYCIAQPALFEALDWSLKQTTPVANYHILFMNKKASSSGEIKPPMALELLEHYTPEQLRMHWLSLALDTKAVSFSPKPYDTSVSVKAKGDKPAVLVKDDPRIADPALKESAFLSNIFNRLARSYFYASQKFFDAHLPKCEPESGVVKLCTQGLLKYEQLVHDLDFHTALSVAEELCRNQNKAWDETSKKALGEENMGAYEQSLANTLHTMKTVSLMMHPAVPHGCELIASQLGFDAEEFFSWKHAFETVNAFCASQGIDPTTHRAQELPPRFDFFKKHESQIKK